MYVQLFSNIVDRQYTTHSTIRRCAYY